MKNDESPAVKAARASLERFQSDVRTARQQLERMGEGSALVDAAQTAVRAMSTAARISDPAPRGVSSGPEPMASAQKAAISTVKSLVDLAAASRQASRLGASELAAVGSVEPAARTLVDVARALSESFASDVDTSAMFSRIERDAVDAYRQLSGRDAA